MPTAEQLHLTAGSKIRVNPNFLPIGSKTPREVFRVVEAPAPDILGTIVAIGLLSGSKLVFGSTENVISEVVKD